MDETLILALEAENTVNEAWKSLTHVGHDRRRQRTCQNVYDARRLQKLDTFVRNGHIKVDDDAIPTWCCASTGNALVKILLAATPQVQLRVQFFLKSWPVNLRGSSTETRNEVKLGAQGVLRVVDRTR